MDKKEEKQFVEQCVKKVLDGGEVTRQEAKVLSEVDLELLSEGADRIRKHYQKDAFDMCGILSLKGGQCSEDCAFCPQSTRSTAERNYIKLRTPQEILEDAKQRDAQGVCHYCMVSSGHHLSDREIDVLCEAVRLLREQTKLMICVSGGLLQESQLKRLKEAGLMRIHNNLETSPQFFATLCTTHTYQDKLNTIQAAKKVGLELCCGGLFGMGESMDDRIDLAFELKKVQPDTVPINMLDPVAGIPLENQKVLTEEEVRRIIALFKYILPHAWIRLAAGRDYLQDTGLKCFQSGCNAAITGDLLNLVGTSVEEDMQSVQDLGYEFCRQS